MKIFLTYSCNFKIIINTLVYFLFLFGFFSCSSNEENEYLSNVSIDEDENIHPECSLFIPDGFSPNGDGVHDFFIISCIEKYPDAVLSVFDMSGNKLFGKKHYGNLDYWNSDKNAWWWGTIDNKHHSKDSFLPAGQYYYTLELENGKIVSGIVMIYY